MKRADTEWKAAIATEVAALAERRRWNIKTVNPGPPTPNDRDTVGHENAMAQWWRTRDVLAPDGTRARGPEKIKGNALYPTVQPVSLMWARPWRGRKQLHLQPPHEGPWEFCEECGCFCSVEETDSVDNGVGQQTFSLGRRCEVCEEDWSDRQKPQQYFPPWARGPYFHGYGRPSSPVLENVILSKPLPQYKFTGFFEADGEHMDLRSLNMNADSRAWYDARRGNDRRARLLVQDPYDLDTKPREFRTLHWYDAHYAEMAKRITALLVA